MSVSATLTSRWRSRRYVGAAKPAQTVRVRRVLMDRAYQEFVKLDGSRDKFGTISGGKHNHAPWQAVLQPDGDWVTLPNVDSVELSQELDEQGMAAPETATVHISNVNFKEATGAAGLYHLVKRGYYSPWQGYSGPGRLRSAQAENEWFDVLNGGIQVEIWQGYGNALEKTFTGLVDDCDVADRPDSLQILGRSFLCMTTDQRVFMWSKAADVPSPVVFCDRMRADEVEKKGYNARASSSQEGYPSANTMEKGFTSFWLSSGHDGPNYTEWVQQRMPKGRYETAFLYPRYAGMEVYLSIYCRNGCTVDGEEVDDGWLDRSEGDTVPGAEGGHTYVKKWRALDAGAQAMHFGFILKAGKDTAFRFSFRNLGYSPKYNDYRASVARMYGARRKLSKEAKKHKWILVDDGADVVKWVLMWAGFHEYEVERMGVPLKEKVVFHQSNYLADIIKHMVDQGGFEFFMKRPTAEEDSIGVPVFRRQRATTPPQHGIVEVKDTDLLTGVQVKFSKEPLAYILRTRGKVAKKAQGGRILGEDRVRRLQANYYPPWSGAHHGIATGPIDQTRLIPPAVGRLAGVYKHFVMTEAILDSENELQMNNLIAALRMALASFTGQIEIPAYPGFELDEQVSIVDSPTGLNTRMWVGHRSSTFTAGEETEWKMTLGGAMIDTPDILLVGRDYAALLQKVLEESVG